MSPTQTDAEQEVYDVTEQLDDLKNLLRTYEHQSCNLQDELRRAQEDFKKLTVLRDSTVHQQALCKKTCIKELTRELKGYSKLIEAKDRVISELQKKLENCRNELDVTLEQLEVEKQKKRKDLVRVSGIHEKCVQTTEQYDDEAHRRVCGSICDCGGHISGFLEITSALQELLCRGYAQRSLDSAQHSDFIEKLAKSFKQRYSRARDRQHSDKVTFCRTLEEMVGRHIESLRKERNALQIKLMESETSAREASQIIAKLERKVKYLSDSLQKWKAK